MTGETPPTDAAGRAGRCCAAPAADVSLPADDAGLDAAFKALASPQRRQLLRLVAASTSDDGVCCATEVCACTLSEALGLAPSTISHHMAALVGAGLVDAEKRGLWVYYRVRREALSRVAGQLTQL